MLPTYKDDLKNDITIVSPSKTYALDINKGVISGFTDGIVAMKQANYLILSTEINGEYTAGITARSLEAL